MSVIEPGATVRTLLDVQTDSGAIVPPGARGIVVGHQGDRLVVEFEDRDSGETATAVLDRWEVRR